MSYIFSALSEAVSSVKDTIIDIVVWIILFLPESSGIPTYVLDAVLDSWSLALSLDFLIPVSHLPAVLLAFFVFEGALLTWKLVVWITGLIRG